MHQIVANESKAKLVPKYETYNTKKENFKFTPFLVKFTLFVCLILCRLNFKNMFFY